MRNVDTRSEIAETLGFPESHLASIIQQAVSDALDRRPTEKLAYTFRQAADVTGLPWTTIRDAHSRGEIKAKRPGREWIISREELIRWLNR